MSALSADKLLNKLELLPSQKQALHDAVKAGGLDPGVLFWSQQTTRRSSEDRPTMSLPGTPYFFTFDVSFDERFGLFSSPGETRITKFSETSDWKQVLAEVTSWVIRARRESSIQNPWLDLENYATLAPRLADSVEQTKFSASEHRQVVKTLEVIKSLLIMFAKDQRSSSGAISERVAQIEHSVGLLSQAAEAQDRKAFFYLLVGFISSTAVSMALAPDQTRQLFSALHDGFKGAVQLLLHS